MIYTTINPSTEEELIQYPLCTLEEIKQHIAQSHEAFLSWRDRSFSEKSQLMQKLANLLKEKQESLALLITTEMGKPITQSRAEITKCIWVCEHYAEQAEHYLQPRAITTDLKKTQVSYQPLGVIFSIMPWNFPFWQVFRAAAPTIMAGNTLILKHAPISLGVGNAIQTLFLEAGFPTHVFSHLLVSHEDSEVVIQDERIRGVSFTGSEAVGRKVGSEAAFNLKKAVLELGGSDPYVVLADADVKQAAHAIVSSRLNNCGQVCISAKRVIVVTELHDELMEAIKSEMSIYQMNDPTLDTTNLGPMARKDLREKVHEQIQASIAQGAKLVMGGTLPECTGFFYPATLIDHVEPGMVAFDEEVFGPVISLITAKDEKQAIRYANQTRFGLGAAVFTRDIQHGEALATYEIEAGSCFVNTWVASDPRVPFGGIKHSGFGRELSREGILSFVNVKTVSIK